MQYEVRQYAERAHAARLEALQNELKRSSIPPARRQDLLARVRRLLSVR